MLLSLSIEFVVCTETVLLSCVVINVFIRSCRVENMNVSGYPFFSNVLTTNSRFFWWKLGLESRKALSMRPMTVPFLWQRGCRDSKCKYLPEKVFLCYQLNEIKLFCIIIITSKKFNLLSMPTSIVNCNLGWNLLNVCNTAPNMEGGTANTMSSTYL